LPRKMERLHQGGFREKTDGQHFPTGNLQNYFHHCIRLFPA